jgi:hypothetical protein
VVVEPKERGGHLRLLVRVKNRLRLPRPESVRGDRRVAVVLGGDEAAVQVRHDPYLVPERRQACVDRNPGRIGPRQVMEEVDGEGRAALPDDSHPEGASLACQSGAVVVGPERRRRQVRVELP